MSVFKKRRFTLRKNKDAPLSPAAEGAEPEESAERSTEPVEPEYEIIPPATVDEEVPTFFHIGRWAKECLITGYRIGAWHIDCTSRSGENISLYSFGTGKPDHKTIVGGVGIKEKLGYLTLTQAWLTDELIGMLGVQKKIDNVGAEALLRGSYNRSESAFKVDLHGTVECSPVKIEVIAPILHTSKVMGYALLQPFKSCMLAYRTIYDFDQNAFLKHAFGAGFYNNFIELGIKLEDFQDVRGSIFQRLGPKWAIALKASLLEWKRVEYSIGCQCMVDESTLIKGKLTSEGYLGIVYQQLFAENIRVMYHFGVPLADPIKGNHKLGISWSFNC